MKKDEKGLQKQGEISPALLLIRKKIDEQMQKSYGENAVLVPLSELPEPDMFSTGIAHLDILLNGGVPKGCIVHIYGKEQSGKTSLALSLAGQHDSVLYLDGERKITRAWADIFGAHGDFTIAQPICLEAAFERARLMIQAGTELVIIDSLPSLPSLKELEEKDYSKNTGMAHCAGFLARKLAILNDLCRSRGATLVIVNQLRKNTETYGGYGEQWHTFGGNMLPSIATVAIRVARKSWMYQQIKGEKIAIGHELAYQVDKSNRAAPHASGGIPLIFNRGFVPYEELKDVKKENARVTVEEITEEEA